MRESLYRKPGSTNPPYSIRVEVACLVAGLVLVSLSVASEHDHDIELVRTYLTNDYSFDHPITKIAALGVNGIEQVQDWPVLRELKNHRLYSFPTSNGTPFTFALVAVRSPDNVFLLDGIKHFNEMFSNEEYVARDDAMVVELAQFFLSVQMFNFIKTRGLDLGVRVIHTAADISYPKGEKGANQLERVENEFDIRPPTLTKTEKGFQYVLYAWHPIGGALSRYTIVLNENRIMDYEVEVLTQWIGRVELQM